MRNVIKICMHYLQIHVYMYLTMWKLDAYEYQYNYKTSYYVAFTVL